MWKWTVTFKLCPVATNVPFVCLGSTAYAITPACTFNTRKDALYVVCLPNSDPVINITNQYLLDLAVFSPTSSSYPVLVVTCFFLALFHCWLTEWQKIGVFCCHCKTSNSKFNELCALFLYWAVMCIAIQPNYNIHLFPQDCQKALSHCHVAHQTLQSMFLCR